ncbi:MAG: flavin-dependent oxidoreductase [Rhizobiaceae bacterium]|nr:flavin-dependent oxidoreductase [Rhizobiaceae bacterium]
MTVLIAGGGIAGLTMGLTLHQLRIPFHIFESVSKPKPLGVGINLQPPAVRELYALGLESKLDRIGVQTRDYGFYTKTGLEIWTEPRGKHAGYNWPQYSVHRGKLQMMLLGALVQRCGEECISFGNNVRSFTTTASGVELNIKTDNGLKVAEGDFLVAADGIHSAIRAQLHPDEGAPVWGGAIMWRGTTIAEPFLTGASMILAGNNTQRFVCYPISKPDPHSGKAVINWIAERTVDPNTHVEKEDWNRQVGSERFRNDFKDWDFGWINVPELIDGASAIFEYPMVDREPVDFWTRDNTTLIGDAAHATYPVGSSGASQALLDTRVLGAAFREHGINEKAALAYESEIRPMANKVTLANRGNGGPDAIMQMAEDRCKGDFSKLDEMLPMEEREAHALAFKKLAGISVEVTNSSRNIL